MYQILTSVRLILITASPILSVRILQDPSVADPSNSAGAALYKMHWATVLVRHVAPESQYH